MKTFLVFVLCSAFAVPGFGATVSSPTNGEYVSSPFTLSASSSSCSNQPVSSMGYSLDSSTSTTLFKGNDTIKTQVSTSKGAHTLHVKAWGDNGGSCVVDVKVIVSNVNTAPVASSLIAPSTATSNGSLQAMSDWRSTKDAATSGWASGSTKTVSSPSVGSTTREFYTSFSNNGGERFYLSFSDDASATNFLYDAYVYLTNSASTIANLEMDMNQVMPNGQTVIYGFQCDGYSGTWDYTANTGTPTRPRDTWIHSAAGCNPRSWTRNTWHHVQIEYSRTTAGYVTYKAVWLDGVKHTIDKSVNSAFALGWSNTLLTNFQVDGLGSGSATVYLSNLTVYRWQ